MFLCLKRIGLESDDTNVIFSLSLSRGCKTGISENSNLVYYVLSLHVVVQCLQVVSSVNSQEKYRLCL